MTISPVSTGALASSGAASVSQVPAPQAASGSQPDNAAIVAARRALAAANSQVDTDKRNQSPDCVAADQKLVDKAQIQLTQAQATVSPVGGLLDLTL